MFFKTENFNYTAETLLKDYLEYTKNKRNSLIYTAQNDTIPQIPQPPQNPDNNTDSNEQVPQSPDNSNEQTPPNETISPEPTEDNNTAPKWPLEELPPRRISSGYYDTNFATDMELMRLLYSNINRLMYPVIVEVLNEYEYDGSPIFSDQIDRETIAQMVDRVLVNASARFDEAQEILLDSDNNTNNDEIGLIWGREPLLRAIAESMLLNDIFGIRRPHFRRIRSNYKYSNGLYGGLNYYY